MSRIPVTETDYAMNLIDILKMHEQYFTAKKMNGGIGIKKRSEEHNNRAEQLSMGSGGGMTKKQDNNNDDDDEDEHVHDDDDDDDDDDHKICSMFMTLLPPLPLGHLHSYIHVNYLTNSSKIVQLHLLPHFLVVVVFTLIALSALLSLLSYLPPFYFLFCA